MRARILLTLLGSLTLLVPVRASAAPLELSPGPTFPDTCAGQQSKVTMTLTNNNSSEVRVDSIGIGGADPSFFEVAGFTPPTTIPAGQKLSFDLVFKPRPNEPDVYSAILNVETQQQNDAPEPREFSADGITRSLTMTPATLTFPEQRIGTRSAEQKITLKSTGSEPVQIKGVRRTGANATEFVLGSGDVPPTLQPGATAPVGVAFQPRVAGRRTGAVHIETNTCDSPNKSVALTGTGIAPSIRIDPQVLDVGQVPLGQPSERVPLVVSNEGKAPLRVTEIQIVGGAASDFAFEALPTLPRVVAAGDSFLLNVIFTPSEDGPRRAGARITSDDPLRAIFEVTMAGIGGAASIPPTTSPTAQPTDTGTPPTPGPRAEGPSGGGGDWIAIVLVVVLVGLAFAALVVLKRIRAEQA